ncbi:Anti-sigma regulatory factor (Ser/Thr protein kinase) [Streptomyces sp. TLI_053]|uniref:ATP-binding protein n=1 Tax=Streptomyces sp. TLI_053 TaxID=1855352 RepID=UPI00087D6B58|nr:ATP-binding protein [Streptomyces sp. TLI_053]SDT77241.1 Anti-sigma regulatory factor (Ser/Thr protein kinase) [Streptomyces sp. TLI_053]
MPWIARFPGVPESAGAARKLVRDALGDHPRVADAELIVSELVTNSVLHSKSGRPGGSVWVEVRRSADTVWIDVADEGGRDGLPLHRAPDEAADFGRGLTLVDALADSWGAHNDGDDFRSVWAQLTSTAEENACTKNHSPISQGV